MKLVIYALFFTTLSGSINSACAQGTIILGPSDPPSITPPAGPVTNGAQITINAPGTIRYRVQDQNMPDPIASTQVVAVAINPQPSSPSLTAFEPDPTNSLPYDGPFLLPTPLFSRTVPAEVTVVALAFQDGAFYAWNTNIYSLPTLPLPEIQMTSTDSGVEITLSCAVPDAEIVYNLSPDVPGQDSTNLYSIPFTLTPAAPLPLTVLARKPGFVSSVASVTIYLIATVTLDTVAYQNPPPGTNQAIISTSTPPGNVVPPGDVVAPGNVLLPGNGLDTGPVFSAGTVLPPPGSGALPRASLSAHKGPPGHGQIVLSWSTRLGVSYTVLESKDLKVWTPLRSAELAKASERVLKNAPIPPSDARRAERRVGSHRRANSPLLLPGTGQNISVTLRKENREPNFFRIQTVQQ